MVASTAWAEHLPRDEDLPADDEAVLREHQVHDAVIGTLAGARWHGSVFFGAVGRGLCRRAR